LICCSEGEIGGLVNGAPVDLPRQHAAAECRDGSYHFQDVIYQERAGTQIQSAVEIYGDAGNIEDEHPVNVEVTQAGGAIVRTITDTTVEAVQITITVPAIYIITDKGDVGAEDAHVVIDRRYTGGGWIQQYSDTNGGLIRGRSNDAYQRDFIVPIAGGTFPVDIRVSRGNPDSTSEKKVNDFIWTSYTEIIYAKFNYANSAYIALRCNSEAFSAIPQRSYLINGIKVAIPSNATADPTTGRADLCRRVEWPVRLRAQWTTDPAMILWDLLTDTRYGFGDHIQAADLDKWAFYAASQYSSALVSDGRGGLEPRFSCNVNIQTAEDAYKLIGDMCSVFRAMPYWGAGALTVSQDAPSDPTYLFTPANVRDGIFNYTGSSLKNRPTVAVVSYMDITLRDIAKEVVEDQALIAKYGVTTTEISAFACTSRSQAHRMGRWMLYSEWNESEVVTFTVGIEAGVVDALGRSSALPIRYGPALAVVAASHPPLPLPSPLTTPPASHTRPVQRSA
jgi:predicted phage tail protein